MSVFRVNKNKDYTTMCNYHLKDKNLGLKAKGLLSIMLSLPDDWNYSIGGLVAISKENETAIKSALQELRDNGYLRITKEAPNKQNGGRFQYIYNIYEYPQKEIQESEKQDIENLPLEILPVENQRQLNTNNKILIINNNNSSSSSNNEQTVYEFLELNFGRTIAPLEYAKINKWLEYFDEEVLKEAIAICVEQAQKKFSYLEGILRNWKATGYKSIQDIKTSLETHKTSLKQQNKSNITANNKKSIVPDWFNEDIQKEELNEEEKNEIMKILKI